MVNKKSLENLEKAKGKGRPKGSKNTFTDIKEEMFECFKQNEFRKWAKTHQSEFYKIIASLIPKELTGKDGVPLFPAQVQIINLPAKYGKETERIKNP